MFTSAIVCGDDGETVAGVGGGPTVAGVMVAANGENVSGLLNNTGTAAG